MNNNSIYYICDQIQSSPNAFHATSTLKDVLISHGFNELFESDDWGNVSEGHYFVTRNDSSLIAFTICPESLSNGFAMVGAHTDSPCLKVKPNPDLFKNGYYQTSVEVYGGVLLNPWFDRELSLAGKVSYLSVDNSVKTSLINFESPIAIIPSLAIHLDREANKKRSINPQTDIKPIWCHKDLNFDELCINQLIKQGHTEVDSVLDYELFFYDVQPPSVIGFEEDFLVSSRLDNLLSCFIGLDAMIKAGNKRSTLLVCTDHEEVGSSSHCGADGPFLQSVLQRLIPDTTELQQCVHHSMMISVDNAHGIHPNFSDKHDSNHGPILNDGPVIKLNANQRYATNAETSGFVKHIARLNNVPVQSFVVRSDMACGSTIGPITSANIGIKTADIGVPTFAMHSIREMAGVPDVDYLQRLLTGFFEYEKAFV